MAVAAAGGGLLHVTVKELVGRARPDLAEPLLQAAGHAFPSGHTGGTTLGVGILLVVLLPRVPRPWRPVVLAAGVLLAVAVGATRVVLGVHWPSDVVAGWLLSSAWVLAVLAAGARPVRRRHQGAPTPSGP